MLLYLIDFTSATRPEHPGRQPSLDQETIQKLERRLSERPDKTQLVDRNILKGEHHHAHGVRTTDLG